MKVYFRDHNYDLIQALLKRYNNPSEHPWSFDAVIECCDVLEKTVDAVVSPANSFGIMDGGVDLHYSKFFGWDLSRNLQEKIKETKTFGEILVGDALTIETGRTDFKYLIAAPTMRLPCRVSSLHSFLATRAAMNQALLNKYISSIVFPGMATGVGGVSAEEAAEAMLVGCQAAFKHYNK